MRLEVGKKYITRGMTDVLFAEVYDRDDIYYYACFRKRDGTEASFGFLPNGCWNMTGDEHEMDLIAEYVEPTETKEETALRYNSNKIPLTMLSPIAMIGTSRVLTYGQRKYSTETSDARDNWRKGLSTTETIDSLLRHLLLYLAGEERDQESGEAHIDHVSCNVMFLQEMFHTGRKRDDLRFIKEENIQALSRLLSTPIRKVEKK